MIVDLYNRVSQLTKTGTAGYVNQDEFNSIIAAKQLTLLQLLMEVEDKNGKAADMLKWLKGIEEVDSDGDGIITLPDDYLYFGALTFVTGNGNLKYPVTLLTTDELDMTRTSPIRKPNAETGDVYCYFEEGKLVSLPEIDLNFLIRYYRNPPAATITLTPNDEDDSDYLTPTAGAELGWPESANNILAYLVLMDYGIELKEQAIMEFSQYGINVEMVKSNP